MNPQRQQFLTILVSTLLVYTALAYVTVTPRPQEELLLLGPLLGPGRLVEDYYPNDSPNITQDTEVNWFLPVTSLMATTHLITIKIKLGNKTTPAPNSTQLTPAPLETLRELPRILTHNETWETHLNWSISEIQTQGDAYTVTLTINGHRVTPTVTTQGGLNLRLIIELWTLDTQTRDMIFGWYSGGERRAAWLQVWFNATKT